VSALHESHATLRFFGDDLDPDEVTALLGGPPTHATRKGDLRCVRNGREVRELRGSWRCSADPRIPGDLDGLDIYGPLAGNEAL